MMSSGGLRARRRSGKGRVWVCLRGRRDGQGQSVHEPARPHPSRKHPLGHRRRRGAGYGWRTRRQHPLSGQSENGKRGEAVHGRQSPRSVAVGAGAVWVANEADDNVTRIDASSGSSLNIYVGTGPTGVAYGAGAVWVANAGDGTVSRSIPRTDEVVKVIPVGNRPTGIAFGEGAVWVTVPGRPRSSSLQADRGQVEVRVHDEAAEPLETNATALTREMGIAARRPSRAARRARRTRGSARPR